MIYINNKDKVNNIKLTTNNYYVVTDFDQTITSGTSAGSWGINMSRSEDFIKERNDLYNKYRPIEIDNNIPINEKFKLMKNWYEKSLEILLKYGVTENEIIQTVKSGKFHLRDGAKDFLKQMNCQTIPVLILSAGIGNVIIETLKNNKVFFENIYLDSNFLIFENGKIKGISNEIIHTLNKNSEHLIEKFGGLVKDKKNIILFGDVLSDINMVRKEDLHKTITIGFLDSKVEENLNYYNNTFDIVCTNNTSFNEIMDILKI